MRYLIAFDAVYTTGHLAGLTIEGELVGAPNKSTADTMLATYRELAKLGGELTACVTGDRYRIENPRLVTIDDRGKSSSRPASRANPTRINWRAARSRSSSTASANPLRRGYSAKTLHANIADEIARGVAPDQAAAMAYRSARAAYRKRHPRGKFPAHLQRKPNPAAAPPARAKPASSRGSSKAATRARRFPYIARYRNGQAVRFTSTSDRNAVEYARGLGAQRARGAGAKRAPECVSCKRAGGAVDPKKKVTRARARP